MVDNPAAPDSREVIRAAQREAKFAPRRRFGFKQVKHQSGPAFLRSPSGDYYASNHRGDLIKVSKKLTGKAARWSTRINERVKRALSAWEALFNQPGVPEETA